MMTKTISGRIALSDAAAIGLVGTIERMKSAKLGASPTGAALVSASRSAAADSTGSGKRLRNRGVSSAAAIDEVQSRTTNRISARVASLLARAASRRGGDAGDQQRDDQRHDRHLQRVEPQAADRLGDRDALCSTQAPPLQRRGDAGAEADDESEQDPGRLREFQKRRPSDFIALSGP